jgi:tetratricopeptide (TPR) repeat protein
MASVFLSHSSKDKPFVRELADFLEKDGDIKVWLDEREVDFGENIVSKIEQGLGSKFVLLILSPDSVESAWVREEWTAAFWRQMESRGVKLACVLYRACQIPLLLANKRYFDLTTNQLDEFRRMKSWLLEQRPPAQPIVHLPPRQPLFIEREAEIKALDEQLKEPGSVAYLCGAPGLGKTRLAEEYARRRKQKYYSVHWLPCQARTLAQIAAELQLQLGITLDGDLAKVLQQLGGHCAWKHRLLILDNVEDEAPGRLLPVGESCVLVTTRRIDLRFLRPYRAVRLPLFTEEQCFELFRKEIGDEEVQKQEPQAKALFQRLGCLPLGVHVAASLIREDVRFTIEGMAKDLPADVTALLREAVGALSDDAKLLLSAMAVCAPEGFALSTAAAVGGLDEPSSLERLQEIHSRSLVEELDRTGRTYRLHALVREVAGASDEQRMRHAEFLRDEFGSWEKNWRHCERRMADWHTAFAWLLMESSTKAWELANRLAYTGYSLTFRVGRLPEAYEICERMSREAESRSDSERRQAWYGNQALILKAWGRLEEAMGLHKKEEAICEELGNRDGLQRSYGNQALILQAWGRLEEAMALLKKQEAICEELGNRNSLQRSYGNQALILQDWGRLEEAMALLKKQEAICEELGNRDGLQASYGNQALILSAWGRLEEAMALHKKEEAICEELGDRDGLSASYGNQALILKAWGRLEEAMGLHKKEEAICEELGSRDGLQRSYGNQALILQAWGRLEEAMALLKKQEAICEELGNRDSLARCYWSWGSLAGEMGDGATEREKLRQALAIFTELGMPGEIKSVQAELDRANHGSQPD